MEQQQIGNELILLFSKLELPEGGVNRELLTQAQQMILKQKAYQRFSYEPQNALRDAAAEAYLAGQLQLLDMQVHAKQLIKELNIEERTQDDE